MLTASAAPAETISALGESSRRRDDIMKFYCFVGVLFGVLELVQWKQWAIRDCC